MTSRQQTVYLDSRLTFNSFWAFLYSSIAVTALPSLPAVFCPPIQYSTLPCSTLSSPAVLCPPIQYSTLPCSTRSSLAELCPPLQYSVFPYSTLSSPTVLYPPLQYSVLLWSILSSFAVLCPCSKLICWYIILNSLHMLSALIDKQTNI